MRPFGFVAGALACTIAACGSQDDGQTSTVSGTFAGQTVPSADSAAFTGSAGSTAFLSEVISNSAGVCSVAGQHVVKSSSTRLQLLIVTSSQTEVGSIGPGRYAITNGEPAKDAAGTVVSVSADYNTLDANCRPTIAGTASAASSGTITVDSLTASRASGSFDLRFANGDHLVGSFGSPLCAAAAPTPAPALATPAVATTCQE